MNFDQDANTRLTIWQEIIRRGWHNAEIDRAVPADPEKSARAACKVFDILQKGTAQ